MAFFGYRARRAGSATGHGVAVKAQAPRTCAGLIDSPQDSVPVQGRVPGPVPGSIRPPLLQEVWGQDRGKADIPNLAHGNLSPLAGRDPPGSPVRERDANTRHNRRRADFTRPQVVAEIRASDSRSHERGPTPSRQTWFTHSAARYRCRGGTSGRRAGSGWRGRDSGRPRTQSGGCGLVPAWHARVRQRAVQQKPGRCPSRWHEVQLRWLRRALLACRLLAARPSLTTSRWGETTRTGRKEGRRSLAGQAASRDRSRLGAGGSPGKSSADDGRCCSRAGCGGHRRHAARCSCRRADRRAWRRRCGSAGSSSRGGSCCSSQTRSARHGRGSGGSRWRCDRRRADHRWDAARPMPAGPQEPPAGAG